MSAWTRFLHGGSAPSAAVEITAHRVSVARIESRPGGMTVAGHAIEALPDRALVPSLTAPNLHDRATVLGVLRRALEGIGRPRRIGLVVPDPVAKVSLVRFDKVPARAEDLDQLIRWQVRKTVPFPLDEAQLSYIRGDVGASGQDFIVEVARRDVVQEYEALCAEAGAHAGIVDLSTFNVANAVLAGTRTPPGDWLLVNVAPDYASLAIFRGQHLIFFRSRGADADETLTDLVHQTAMYYEDRLEGKGFRKVILCGGAASDSQRSTEIGQIRRGLAIRLGGEVEGVDSGTVVSFPDRIAPAPDLVESLAPLVGLLLRDREAA